MPILVVKKVLFGNYMEFMPIYHIKSEESSPLVFFRSLDEKGTCPYILTIVIQLQHNKSVSS